MVRLTFITVLIYAIGCVCQRTQVPLSLPSLHGDKAVAAQPTKVVIIGAGAAGSSTAYYLSKFAAAHGLHLNITIYERSSYIGGRSTTVDVLDDPAYPVELGASIFVHANEILYNATVKFDLPIDEDLGEEDPEADFSLGVWDGSQFVFRQPQDGSGWWDMVKLFWRYGLSPLKTQQLMKSTISDFLTLYSEPLFPWKSLTKAVEQIGLLDFTTSTGGELLEKNRISEQWAREIVQSSTRVNYGQNLATIHGLETMVCMATDGAMSVRGGNWRIFEGMVEASKANLLLNSTVVSVNEQVSDAGRKSYTIKSELESDKAITNVKSDIDEFDIVVLATPLQYTDFATDLHQSVNLRSIPDEIPYVSLYVTLLATPHRVSSDFFKIDSTHDRQKARASIPSMVLTTLSSDDKKLPTDTGPDGVGPTGFWSVNRLRTIFPDALNNLEQELHVYKIFSPAPINATFVAQMFDIPHVSPSSIQGDPLSEIALDHLPWYYTKTWNSYPYLFPRVTFEDLRLDADPEDEDANILGSIWYTSGIESFISTMETSALMGMNVARLIVDGLAAR